MRDRAPRRDPSHPSRAPLARLRALIRDLRVFAWMAREAGPTRPARRTKGMRDGGSLDEARSFGEVWDHPA